MSVDIAEYLCVSRARPYGVTNGGLRWEYTRVLGVMVSAEFSGCRIMVYSGVCRESSWRTRLLCRYGTCVGVLVVLAA